MDTENPDIGITISKEEPRSGSVHRAGRMPLPLGTETAHGTVAGLRFDGVERYYFLRSNGAAAFMPADVIEGHPTDQGHGLSPVPKTSTTNLESNG